MRSALLGACAALALGCGYHVAGAAGDPLGPFDVTGGETRTPYAEVMAAAEEGARAELARVSALAAGGHGKTAIVVEVLRVDETSEAPALFEGVEGPRARAVRVAVIGRGTVRRDGAIERDTGDVRADEVIAPAGDPRAAILTRDEAARRAARRLGEILARRLLGFPEPGDP
jgi:hypothetical protein